MFVIGNTIPLLIISGKADTTAVMLGTRISSMVTAKSCPQSSLHILGGVQRQQQTGYTKLAATLNNSVEQDFYE